MAIKGMYLLLLLSCSRISGLFPFLLLRACEKNAFSPCKTTPRTGKSQREDVPRREALPPKEALVAASHAAKKGKKEEEEEDENCYRLEKKELHWGK